MIPTITAFERSPDRGRGQARDMRVRWALEEVGQPYDVRLVSFSAMREGAHRALNPFGQIPTYEAGDLTLFESGAIVFHIAERHRGLLPDEANARARAITWMFAALSLAAVAFVLHQFLQLVACTADREALVVQQVADAADHQHLVVLVITAVATPLHGAQLREFLLPIP